eukprot:9654691-Lingulodinium_polyedra.AAC.1
MSETPKEYRCSWQHLLLCRVALVELGDPVPTRYKPKLVAIMKERIDGMGARVTNFPLVIEGGELKLDMR